MRTRLSALSLGVLSCCCLSAGVAAQHQFETLQRYLPADIDRTRAVAMADVDGDGAPDLVLGSDGEQDRLYLNDGRGSFGDATARLPADADSTLAVALGDVDGDSDPDLVLATNGQNRLYLNDGTGTFTDATVRLPVSLEYTGAVALGDVDGDADLDVVFGNQRQNRLYLNDGMGSFTDVTAARLPGDLDFTTAVALGDVDGDGDPDLVWGNLGRQNRLYLNEGGTFTDVTAARMPGDSDSTRAAVLSDVDGDADLDLVLGNDGQQNDLYLNDGTGRFVEATPRLPATTQQTYVVVSADVDGDGDLDLVTGNNGGAIGRQNRLYLNDGTGTFADATAARLPALADSTFALALEDVDGDGDPDLVVGNVLQQNRLHLNDGAGAFGDAAAPRIPVDTAFTRALALGDVDGDRDADLVLGNASGGLVSYQNRLYLNDGTGSFTDATARIPVDSDDTRAVALGDLDGDGDLDLVVGNSGRSGGLNRVYLNEGAAFTDVTAARIARDLDATEAVLLADLDGDGDLDLVAGNSTPGRRLQNRLYFNEGAGWFNDLTARNMPVDGDETRALAAGDVDRDGDLDLVIGNTGSFVSQNRLYLNDGTGTFTDATAARMPADADATHALALGDVDGDGDLDLVLGGQGQNRLYLNGGAGSFTDVTEARMPLRSDDTWGVALADVDRDGDLDVAFASYGWPGEQNRLYLNDGSGAFTDATAARLPAAADPSTAAVLGDVDGDGDPDLVFGNYLQTRLYTNLHHQLVTPVLPTLSRSYDVELFAEPGYASSDHTGTAVLSAALAPSPLSLPSLGTFYLAPPLVVLAPVPIPRATGKGVSRLVVPGSSSLVGSPVHLQALIASNANPAGDARLTGHTADAVRR